MSAAPGRSSALLLGGTTRHRLLLVGLLLLHLGVNWSWWQDDLELTWADESWHFIHAQYASSVLTHQGPVGLMRWLSNEPPNRNPFWPLTRVLPGTLLTRIIQPSWVAHRLGSALFLGPLLLAVYLLGRRFWSRDAGLAAAALTSFYPITFGASRHLSPDIIGAALIAGNLYLLFATERFSKVAPSLLLGLCMGAGFLFRPHYPIFFAAPLAIYTLVSLVHQPRRPRKILLLNMGVTTLATLAAAAPFWWGVLPYFFSTVHHHLTGEIAAPFLTPDKTPLAYYMRVLPLGASPPLFWASTAGLALLLLPRARLRAARLRKRRLELGLLMVSVLTGFAFLCGNDHNLIRYLAPIYPLLAVGCMLGLFAALPPWPRRLLLTPLLLAAAGTWIACSFTSWRPGDGKLVHCEPCWSAEQTGMVETAGPPVKDGRWYALMPMVETLRQRHGQGQGVLLRLIPPYNSSLVTTFITLPVVLDLSAIRLVDPNAGPDVWQPEVPFAEFKRLDDSNLVHRYTLVFAPMHQPPREAWRPPPGATLIKRSHGLGKTEGDNFSLWKHPPPADIRPKPRSK